MWVIGWEEIVNHFCCNRGEKRSVVHLKNNMGRYIILVRGIRVWFKELIWRILIRRGLLLGRRGGCRGGHWVWGIRLICLGNVSILNPKWGGGKRTTNNLLILWGEIVSLDVHLDIIIIMSADSSGSRQLINY